MLHQPYDDRRDPGEISDILATDEVHPSLGRQLFNGLSGLLVLLVTGVLIVLMVLWKSP